ncbi:hypothetical protein NM208_g7732 [Fusarium decemcellulare]|uniref:Uncharacterized protein n=1 Tax=Fusarium decemcellulare TaxID=57161 RepID=A0ACC1S7Y1_9HYPO|nr:hypothetical protein NM208_g7732 [Fusarium decemcellulare]
MASRICEDLNVIELLNCLRSTQDGTPGGPPNPACPELTVRDTWTRLHDAWWAVALQVQKEDAENGRESDPTLLDWPAFVKQQIPPDVPQSCSPCDPFRRLGSRRCEDPTCWPAPELISSLQTGCADRGTVALVSSLGSHGTTQHTNPITEQSVRRHNNESPAPPQILNVDVETAMDTLLQRHPRVIVDAATRARQALRGHQDLNDETPSSDEEQSTDSSHARTSASADHVSSVVHGSTVIVSNRRKRNREEEHDVLSGPRSSGAPTPELGRRRSSQGSPLFNLDKTTPNAETEPQRSEKRLEALRMLVELGPTVETDGETFVARQTRGLIDSIVHLSHLALEGLQSKE